MNPPRPITGIFFASGLDPSPVIIDKVRPVGADLALTAPPSRTLYS
jgi:hypothetical protein